MGLFKRSPPTNTGVSPSQGQVSSGEKDGIEPRTEDAARTASGTGFKLNKAGEGDEALALFSDVNDVHEDVDPAEEKRVVRKIDLMILPVSPTSQRKVSIRS